MVASRALVWGASLLVLGRIAAFALFGPQALEPDTHQLVVWSAALRTCLAAGALGACEGAGHFPLFQYVPALALGMAGVDPLTVVRTLAVVSCAAFLGLLAAGWRALGALPGARALWLVVMGSGPLLYYAQSSFGEALAAFLIASVVMSCWSRWPLPAIAGLAALAGITKEFAPAVVMALAVVASLAGEPPRSRRRVLVAVALGSLVAMVANTVFNLARFGVPYNAILLGPTMPSVPRSDRQSFFMGLWLSPNGGLVFFWATFVAVLAVALLQSLRQRLPQIPAIGVIGLLVALTYGLSGWWAPFGWIAWGPRLLLPWIPACLVILVRAYPPSVLMRGWSGGGAQMVAMTFVALAGFSQFSGLYGYEVIPPIFGPAPGCPTMPTDPAINPRYYFYCMDYYVWEPRISPWHLFGTALRPSALLFALAYLIAVVGWWRRIEVDGVRADEGRLR